MAVEFLVLGRVEAWAGGVRLDLGPARQQHVLVALLAEPNRVVSPGQLAQRAWGEETPASTPSTLRAYLSRLRNAMAGVPEFGIGRRAGGYVLSLDPDLVDLHRFSAAVAQAHATDDDDRRLALLEQALAMWRGEAFAEMDTPWINALRDRVEAVRVTAELDHTDLRLRRGQHTALVGELVGRAAGRPLDERLAAQVMLAFYRSGRQAEALLRYDRIRTRLADELGTDPCPALRELHQQILTDSPAVRLSARADEEGRRPPVSRFGAAVLTHRQRLGLTQEELAGRTGLSVRAIRDLETGRANVPRQKSVRLLADAFGLRGWERERFEDDQGRNPDRGGESGTPVREHRSNRTAGRGRRADVRLLGPVAVAAGGTRVDLGAPRQRAVFAALAADAGAVVSVDRIVERVWGPAPPSRVREALQVYVARIRGQLRQATGTDRVLRQAPGYLLDIDRLGVDVHRFHALVDQARAPACQDEERAELLRTALELCGGTPLADIAGDWAERTRSVWEQHRVDAVLAWSDVELRLGRPQGIVDRLIDLAARHPLAEPVIAMLMRALCAVGRYAEALNHYSATRKLLAEHLAVEPGAELRTVHQSILRGELGPGAASAPVDGPAATVTPMQLPMDPRGFTGRDVELCALEAIAGQADDPPVVVINGTAGVGKTALAVHWAHRIAHRFPDGQLFVNLRGFDSGPEPMTGHEALRGFLAALGVAEQRIPGEPQARIGLYRSLLAGSRVLIMLDNAREAEQVRPLLPAAPGCLVLITSRDQLRGLVATEAARTITVHLLPEPDARRLLISRLGPDRIAAEPQACEAIIARCARLPLALAVVAARAAGQPDFPLSVIADELGAANRLDLLSAVDVRGDVRAVLTWSYDALPADAARLFRLLGHHPGPDISIAAAAALGGLPVARTRQLVTTLTAANLLTESSPDRYGTHDLLRLLSVELSAGHDHEAGEAAKSRMYDYYRLTTWQAVTLVRPTSEAPADFGGAHGLTDRDEAIAWLDTELPNIVALAQQCARTPASTGRVIVELLQALRSYLPSRGRWDDFITLATVVQEATKVHEDAPGRALALACLAIVDRRAARFDSAVARLTESLAIRQAIGDPHGEAVCLVLLGMVLDSMEHPAAAIRCMANSLHLHRRLGATASCATTLHNLAESYAHAGRLPAARRFLERSLALRKAVADPFGEACTTVGLGQVHALLGDRATAAALLDAGIAQGKAVGYPETTWNGLVCRSKIRLQHGEVTAAQQDLAEAAAIAHEIGDRYFSAITLRQWGRLYEAIGEPHNARNCAEQAEAILHGYRGVRTYLVENFLDSTP
ncbi:MAG TPA: BTAD domain-containing putative transcriptional regulator [Actinophytocola sp.]|uniref:BTAD domain-containing putative transcriptional regulator n=1 Tax=Actinophytocola sp. TaxID=1872138 RepID=UPI002DBA61E7|nr:BTAD domain-containing putative transcriptional regulator [Actinophytocola sp.]HEU5471043.1 BTAD domain-containing putative transcriptional regulator [Actinophytocola sp.]